MAQEFVPLSESHQGWKLPSFSGQPIQTSDHIHIEKLLKKIVWQFLFFNHLAPIIQFVLSIYTGNDSDF